MRRKCRGVRHLLEQHSFKLVKAGAARARYEGQNVPEVIEIRGIAEGGTPVVIEVPVDVAAGLIINMANAYNAIRPPLRLGQGAAGWQGM